MARSKGLDAWNHICIGSDYDGIMDPFDLYFTSVDFDSLLNDMLIFLQRPEDLVNLPLPIKKSEIFDLMGDLSPDEIIAKIGYLNLEGFLKKYFTNSYLKASRVPVLTS